AARGRPAVRGGRPNAGARWAATGRRDGSETNGYGRASGSWRRTSAIVARRQPERPSNDSGRDSSSSCRQRPEIRAGSRAGGTTNESHTRPSADGNYNALEAG